MEGYKNGIQQSQRGNTHKKKIILNARKKTEWGRNKRLAENPGWDGREKKE